MTSSDLTTEELLHLAEDMLREDREYLESFNAAVHYRAALEIEDRVSGHLGHGERTTQYSETHSADCVRARR